MKLPSPRDAARGVARVASAAAPLALYALPAFAQLSTGGGLDVQSGMSAVVAALLVVFGIIILGVAGWRGIEAVMDHRSVMPSLVGLVCGLALCFGGAWFMTKMNISAGAGTQLL